MGILGIWVLAFLFFFGCGGNEDSDSGNSNSFVEYKSCLDCGKLITDKSLGCQECPLETEENISGRDDNAEKKELDKLYWQFINDAHEKLGDQYVVPGIELEMLWVHPGTFTAGSPKSEIGRLDREKLNEKKIHLGFYLGKYEVSQVQWEAVMGKNPSKFKGANRPVENISWEEAIEFCEKLTQIELIESRLPNGLSFQLPSDSEWEYACRAGTSTAYFWGDSPVQENANYEFENSAGHTMDITSFLPNPWGFFNVHGNCWEFCSDVPGENIVYRFARGGSWVDNSDFMRSAYRYEVQRDSKNHSLGLRIALKVEK